MVEGAPRLRFKTVYSVPPSYAGEWLTDFRPDDGPHWFRFNEGGRVERTPSGAHLEVGLPLIGRNIVDVTIHSVTHWTSETQVQNRKGRVIFRNHIDESVEPAKEGSVLRVQIWVKPQTFGARLMMPMAATWIGRRLRTGFEKMKVPMEEDYRRNATSQSAPRST